MKKIPEVETGKYTAMEFEPVDLESKQPLATATAVQMSNTNLLI